MAEGTKIGGVNKIQAIQWARIQKMRRPRRISPRRESPPPASKKPCRRQNPPLPNLCPPASVGTPPPIIMDRERNEQSLSSMISPHLIFVRIFEPTIQLILFSSNIIYDNLLHIIKKFELDFFLVRKQIKRFLRKIVNKNKMLNFVFVLFTAFIFIRKY